MENFSKFPTGFLFGSATAAYQVEGAATEAGKGPSVWDAFASSPGRVHLGEDGRQACGHYERLEEDLDLMQALGLQAYRFSISWPRLLPEGVGEFNEAGLRFYDRLVNGLIERGIQPWCTLFHWDFPYALYQRGGWLNPESPRWFEDYVSQVAAHFGDRITHWMTLNEPQIFVHHGHKAGMHAPGLRLDDQELVRLTHHVLKAHGQAVQALREHCQKPPQVGWAQAVNAMVVRDPADEALVAAARADQFSMELNRDQWPMKWSWWNDAALLGRYPEDGLAYLGKHLPEGWEEDLEQIRQPLDFLGLNIYSAYNVISRNEAGEVERTRAWHLDRGFPETHFGWPVVPEALYWGPKLFQERYDLPIVITENGIAAHDWIHLDGSCHDAHRIDFTARYLCELSRACRDGVDVRAYFHWSLMDNFEWSEGYKYRFGLIHVDFRDPDLKRTPKDSYYWYRDLIAQHKG